MSITKLQFLSLFFTALTMATGLAHLFELPNKIGLPANEYLTVQQVYRGWAFLGALIFLALLSTLALTIAVRHEGTAFRLTLTAFLAILGTQAIFWTFTFPVNRLTNNWTMLPDDWIQLRAQWEYSHAASAGLEIVAFVALSLALLKGYQMLMPTLHNP